MLLKLKEAFAHPEKIMPHLRYRFGHMMVRKVVRNGESFYSYKGELYPAYLNEGNAASNILHLARRHCSGKGIDVGADRWPFPGAVPVQNREDQNAYKLDAFEDQSLDYVFSSHCLEHLERWQNALSLWIRKLKTGGTLFLYLPHASMLLWRPGSPWVCDGHKWSPSVEVLLPFLESRGMTIVDHNPGRDDYWSFYIVAKKTG